MTTDNQQPTADNNNAQKLDNAELEKAIKNFYESHTQINNVMLLNKLITAKIIVPIEVKLSPKNITDKEISNIVKNNSTASASTNNVNLENANKTLANKLSKEADPIVLTGENINFVLLQDDKQENYCPIFTSNAEYERMTFKNSGYIIKDFVQLTKQIISCDNIHGITINPFGIGLNLTKPMLEDLIKRLDKQVKPEDYTVKAGDKVMIGSPKEEPKELLATLKTELAKHECVDKATLRVMVRPNEPAPNNFSYLIIVECGDPDPTHLFKELADAANPFANKIPLDFVKYNADSSFCKEALYKAKPFYAKNKKLFGLFG